jgi:hypothetical protein
MDAAAVQRVVELLTLRQRAIGISHFDQPLAMNLDALLLSSGRPDGVRLR